MEQLVPNLVKELRGPTLEIGVGTGRIALPLAAAAVDVTGIDISAAMLDKLRQKDPDRTVSLALADACDLPFAADTFSAAVAAHVLHLITDWRKALTELIRVVRPHGTILINLHGEGSGPWVAIWAKMQEILGDKALRPGADRLASVDEELEATAARIRELPPLIDRRLVVPGEFIDMVERGWYSFTWSLPDEDVRAASAEVREWARERYGSLDRPVENEYEVVWRAYDLP